MNLAKYIERATADWEDRDLLWALESRGHPHTSDALASGECVYRGSFDSLVEAVAYACRLGDGDYHLYCARQKDFPDGNLKGCVVTLPNPGGLYLCVRQGSPCLPEFSQELRREIVRANGLPIDAVWIS